MLQGRADRLAQRSSLWRWLLMIQEEEMLALVGVQSEGLNQAFEHLN
jgi:hypothetical protein